MIITIPLSPSPFSTAPLYDLVIFLSTIYPLHGPQWVVSSNNLCYFFICFQLYVTSFFLLKVTAKTIYLNCFCILSLPYIYISVCVVVCVFIDVWSMQRMPPLIALFLPFLFLFLSVERLKASKTLQFFLNAKLIHLVCCFFNYLCFDY